MQVLNLDDYRKPSPGHARTVTFFGIPHVGRDGKPRNLSFSATVENGDVLSVIEEIKKEGGVWMKDDGALRFLPWPPASIEVVDVRRPD